MKIKYRSGYAEGGFLDDGAMVDPVSGNEVPTGSLQEEVRDDIPAQLSEGEFVVPADVVRFIGLDKLMKMRDAAKKGLASMEAEGQIGGSDVPMEMPQSMPQGMPPEMAMQEEPMDIDAMIDGMEDDGMDEGAMLGFAEGGDVSTFASLMGHEFGSVPTTENAVYINADGHKVYIPIVEGAPAYAPPEGYTLVVAEEDKVVEETPEEELEAAAAPTGGDERSANYVNSGKYAGDVARSDSIRKERINMLEGLAKTSMNQEEINVLYGSLSPRARRVYDTRFRDPKMLDSYMSKGMSAVDLLITAQKTADTQNRQEGTTEPNSSYMPDGKPVDWAKALKLMGSGITLGPAGLIGVAKGSMSKEEETETKGLLTYVSDFLDGLDADPKYKDNTMTPTEVKPKEYNQDYWASYTGDDIQAAQYAAEQETGLNAYGHKVYKEPGTRTVWDDIAEVKANQANSVKVRADRAADKIMDTATVNRAAQVAKERADKIAQNAADAATAAAAAAATSGEGDRSGPPGMYDSDEKDKVKEETAAEAAGYAGVSGGGGKAKGGLLTKADKPKVKKMRKDNTSGLAAKKKSKEKAKAKKGALAAKRT